MAGGKKITDFFGAAAAGSGDTESSKNVKFVDAVFEDIPTSSHKPTGTVNRGIWARMQRTAQDIPSEWKDLFTRIRRIYSSYTSQRCSKSDGHF